MAPMLGLYGEFSGTPGTKSTMTAAKVSAELPPQAYKEYHINFFLSLSLWEPPGGLIALKVHDMSMHITFSQKNEARKENCITYPEIEFE